MSAAVDVREQYLARFAAWESNLDETLDSALHQRRRAALALFADHGFPTSRDEEWRHTSLAGLGHLDFGALGCTDAPPKAPELGPLATPDLGGIRLVFVDGRLAPALCRGTNATGSVVATGLVEALTEHAGLLPALGRQASNEGRPFAALNTAFLTDGALVQIQAGTIVTDPIELLFLVSDAGTPALCHPRVLVMVGAGAQATLVEAYAGRSATARLTNAVTEIELGPGASLDHYRLQQEGPATFHLADLAVCQARDSRYRSSAMLLGSGLSCLRVRSVLDGEGADSTLDGLYLGQGEQHHAAHTLVEHRQPHGVSHQLYKGILTDRSTAVFRGRVLVHQAAQQTDAYQSNRNLLLSADAEVNTQPQLEIYADDVKCSHGATVGYLDEEALFYLRSRGIGSKEAARVLTRAFAGEIVDRVRPPALRQYLADRVGERLVDVRP